MPAIFISYRREDTISATGRLADVLAARYGPTEIFRDVEAIEAGADFRVALVGALAAAQVVLVIIGRSWFAGRRRTGSPDQEDPEDYVRFEIETALASDVPVIPVLVEGARMPDPEKLPLSIRALAYRQAHEMSESRWNYDIERLVEVVTRHTGITPIARAQTRGGLAGLLDHPLMSAIVSTPRDLVRLLYEPRRFLAARGAGPQDELTRAFVFVLVSQLIAGMLVVQEWPTRSSLPQFISTAPVLTLLAALAVSVPVYQAWRLCGARHEYRRVLVIVLYQCAFIGLGVAVGTLITLIGMNMMLPGEVNQLASNPTLQRASAFLAHLQSQPDGEPWVIASMISGLIGLGLLIWGLATWESYRIVLHQSRTRSWAALALFTLFCGVPVAFLGWVASIL
jgi:hypothetical protein